MRVMFFLETKEIFQQAVFLFRKFSKSKLSEGLCEMRLKEKVWRFKKRQKAEFMIINFLSDKR